MIKVISEVISFDGIDDAGVSGLGCERETVFS